ncbi:cytochrome b [Dongia sedimenti]|uniref:Cytochrome b n=1 Tax=Dongia sedimenti TaxID=3064282 RepID=A0ABU0YSE9_9PROT|nr:cytochrome b [Rhodospirillaceae bacterium R-7]
MAHIRSSERYGGIAQALHWLTAILVLAAFIAAEGGPESRVYSPERDGQRILHESLGLAVLALVAVRIVWRRLDRVPDHGPMPRWMTLSSALTHGLLYLLLFAVPLTAIFGAWWQGHALNTYLFAEIPAPFAPFHDLGDALTEIHETLGDVIIWLAGLHAAAALFHHFILRDKVLVAMLPRRK